MSTKQPSKMAQAKSTTARTWFFWPMASAVRWSFWLAFPPRPDFAVVLFLVEEAGGVLLAAGFFWDDVFFFAGKLTPSVLKRNQPPRRALLQGQAGKQVVPCNMFNHPDHGDKAAHNQGVEGKDVQLVGGDNPL